MNALIIVIPVLVLLMFCLGLELRPSDFARVIRRPRAASVGLAAQLLGLPLVAFAVARLLGLDPVFAVGLVLLAACPGGASSNAFTMLARGDVALSVTLTAVTSVVTVFTIPLVVNLAMGWWLGADSTLRLSLPRVLLQNGMTILVPVALGMVVRWWRPQAAARLHAVLRKVSLPLLVLMIAVFVVQQRSVLAAHAGSLAAATLLLILGTMSLGALLGRGFRLPEVARRAVLIEVGMQNAAQAIAIAASPFLLNDFRYAIPGVLYAVVMNVVLFAYLGFIRGRALPAGTAGEAA
jgi:BASS family bile acid:Na+ symporter